MSSEAPPETETTTRHLPLYQSAPLAVLLFGFWLLLSGKLDALHLTAGIASAVAIAVVTSWLFADAPPITAPGTHPFAALPWLRVLTYLPWLALQILLSAVQVAAIVIRPRIDIDPQLTRFDCELPHNLARTTLANSITLTPGTVTIDVRGDEFLVHSLTDEAAEAVQDDSEHSMQGRVRRLFGGPGPSTTSEDAP